MKQSILSLAVAALAASSALASDLAITVQSGGSSSVSVAPGATVSYRVTAELSDAQNEGLALIVLDLAFDGGPLSQAQTPTSGPMLSFVSPEGLSNPAGYGGTPVSGELLQVGGAQNTIGNTFAPQPIGLVTTGIAQPGAPVVVVEGTLTAPLAAGTYVLEARDVVASVIRAGEDGSAGFWRVDEAGPGPNTALTVQVSDCAPTTYCTAKPTSQGCLPTIGWVNEPSLSAQANFFVTCDDVTNQQPGLWFHGPGPQSTPFLGGTLCVTPPFTRGPVVMSGGSPPGTVDCSGSLSWLIPKQWMANHGWTVGTTVHGQWWFRDPTHPDGTGIGLSDAIQFTVCP